MKILKIGLYLAFSLNIPPLSVWGSICRSQGRGMISRTKMTFRCCFLIYTHCTRLTINLAAAEKRRCMTVRSAVRGNLVHMHKCLLKVQYSSIHSKSGILGIYCTGIVHMHCHNINRKLLDMFTSSGQ